MSKHLMISLAISAVIIGSAFLSVFGKSGGDIDLRAESPVSFAGGVQVIDIFAKGGYWPRVISAKAGTPTVLRMKTDGTFDCSASLVIPILGYRKFLPPSGIEEIAITPEQAQGTMRGLCSMGMYSFQIGFR